MKKVAGVGINDIKGSSYCPIYKKWVGMLNRCYSESWLKNKPTYIECTVCEEWLIFSKFKDWVEKQDWEDKELDKDLLVSGNKVYSPETCVFIEKKLNMFLTESQGNRGEYPIGVCLNKRDNRFQAHIRIDGHKTYLGNYDTPEQAHEAWREKKKELAKIWAGSINHPKISKALLERFK